MDGLKISDYPDVCRLCLQKANATNGICWTHDRPEITKMVFDCTTILLNTAGETLPHNICKNCRKLLLEWKSFRDYCLKNDELIRLHSLIHCADVQESFENSTTSTAIANESEYLQDISDYVKEELQVELNLKKNFRFQSSIAVCGDVVGESTADVLPMVAQSNVDQQKSDPDVLLSKRKRGRSKKSPIGCSNDDEDEDEEDEEDEELIEIQIETLEEEQIRKSLRNAAFSGDVVGLADDGTQSYLKNNQCNGTIPAASQDEVEGQILPPLSPDTLSHYNRRKKNVPKSGQKYLMDKTLLKPKYYYYVTAKCEVCETVMPRKDLKFHMNEHNGLFPYECEKCGKFFSSPWKRSRHVKVVHVDTLLACDQCGVQFKCKMNLVRHQKKSHQKNVYRTQCTVCDREFSCKDSLKRHMMVHTGERPHVCSFCDKTFTNPFNLKIHMRRHTQEKPYSCNLCGCTFGYSGVLKSHLEKVHKTQVTTANSTVVLLQ